LTFYNSRDLQKEEAEIREGIYQKKKMIFGSFFLERESGGSTAGKESFQREERRGGFLLPLSLSDNLLFLPRLHVSFDPILLDNRFPSSLKISI